MVVGGGPAGLEAARVLAARGHKVTLFEAADELGGQVRLAAAVKRRREMLGITEWLAAECAHYGAEIRTNVLAEEADVLDLDPDLVIVGRTDAAKVLGVEETARRAAAYAATGVDAIFLVGVQTVEDLRAITANVDLPLVLGGTGPTMTDAEELAALGARVWLQGHQPIAASAKAIYDTMKHLRDGGAAADLSTLPEPGFMDRVSRKDEYAAWTEEYL